MAKLNQLITYGFYALLVYMPYHVFLSQWLSTFTGGLVEWKIAKDVFTAALVTLAVSLVILKKKYTRLYLALLALAILYLLLHLLLLKTTDQPLDTGLLATTYNNRLLWYLLIGYSAALLAPKLAHPRTAALALVSVSTIVCLIGLAQWVLPKDVMTHFGYSIERGVKPTFFIDDKPDLPRVMSTIRDPNSLGAFLILPITLLAHGLMRYWNSNRRILLAGLLLLHLQILFLTFSRSAFIGTFLAIASLLILQHGRKAKEYALKFWLPAFIALLVLVGGVFLLRDQYVVQNVVFHADESTTLDDPNELRVKLLERGLEGVASEPLGHGPGTAGLVSTRIPNGLLTENYYLQIAYEVGIIGLILFIALLAAILKQLWLSRRDFLAQGLLASFVGLAFMNMLLHTWANEAVTASWFLLAGLTVCANRRNPSRPVMD